MDEETVQFRTPHDGKYRAIGPEIYEVTDQSGANGALIARVRGGSVALRRERAAMIVRALNEKYPKAPVAQDAGQVLATAAPGAR